MLSAGMIGVPAIMPLFELLYAIWLCVLAVRFVEGVQELWTRIFYGAHFPRLITNPVRHQIGRGFARSIVTL